MSQARATAIFDGNDRGLQNTIKRIEGSLGKLGRGFKANAGQLAGRALSGLGVAGIAAGTGLAYGVKKAYDLGGSLSDASAKTGIAIDQLLILQQAAKDAGIEDVTGAVNKMQRALVEATANGATPAGKALATLGLRADALAQQTPVDALQAIGDRIAAIKSPALATAAAMDIFGRSGAQLLPLFSDSGALGAAAKSIGRQALVLRDNAKVFDQASERLDHLSLKTQSFMVGAALGFAAPVNRVLERLDKVDLASEGERFANAIVEGARKASEIAPWLSRLWNAAKTPLGPSILKAIIAGPDIERVGEEESTTPVKDLGPRSAGKKTSFWKTPDPRLGLGAKVLQGPGLDGEPLAPVGRMGGPLNVFGLKPEVKARLEKEGYDRFMRGAKKFGKDPATLDVPQSLDSFRAGSGQLFPNGALGSGAAGAGLQTGGLKAGEAGAGLKSGSEGPGADGAFGIIRRGDAARRKEAEKAKNAESAKATEDAKTQLKALEIINGTLIKGLLD